MGDPKPDTKTEKTNIVIKNRGEMGEKTAFIKKKGFWAYSVTCCFYWCPRQESDLRHMD